ncbi:MAG: OB-fold domain-containing protein [Anaerolineae bacterium]|nr:OB-fold domain-containing protein [Anaerolineae bacterium]
MSSTYGFGGLGEIYSFTTVMDAPEGFEENAPYVLALVKLDEGPIITAQLTDISSPEQVQIGLRVEMVTRRIRTNGPDGIIEYGYKFRPVHS